MTANILTNIGADMKCSMYSPPIHEELTDPVMHDQMTTFLWMGEDWTWWHTHPEPYFNKEQGNETFLALK